MGYISAWVGDCLSAILASLVALQLELEETPFGLVDLQGSGCSSYCAEIWIKPSVKKMLDLSDMQITYCLEYPIKFRSITMSTNAI